MDYENIGVNSKDAGEVNDDIEEEEDEETTEDIMLNNFLDDE